MGLNSVKLEVNEKLDCVDTVNVENDNSTVP